MSNECAWGSLFRTRRDGGNEDLQVCVEPVGIRGVERAGVCTCRGARRGFTLIELLVVIAIILVLISILLPSLSSARETARRAVCLSNQKQIITAVANYALANREVIPREGSVVQEATTERLRRGRLPWPVALRPLMDDRSSDDGDLNDLFENAMYYADPSRPKDNHRIHYVTNAMPMVEKGVVDLGGRFDYWRRRGPTRTGRLLFPSETVHFAEFSDDANQRVWNAMQTLPATDLDRSQLYDVWDILHLEPNSSDYRIAATRHSGGGNVVYLDGHAAGLGAAQLKSVDTWDDRDYGIRKERLPGVN